MYHSISQNGKFLDRPFRYIQNAIGKGFQPLASVWYKIIQCETALKKQNTDKSATASLAPNLEVDFAELRQLLDLALRMFGMASAQLVIQRHLDLQCFIAPGFQKLCEDHMPFTRWMFGENANAQIDDTTKINRMVKSANKNLAPGTAPTYGHLRKSFFSQKARKVRQMWKRGLQRLKQRKRLRLWPKPILQQQFTSAEASPARPRNAGKYATTEASCSCRW